MFLATLLLFIVLYLWEMKQFDAFCNFLLVYFCGCKLVFLLIIFWYIFSTCGINDYLFVFVFNFDYAVVTILVTVRIAHSATYCL